MAQITGNEPINFVPGNYRIGGEAVEGLTIRQYFAAMAMQGLLCNASIVTGTKDTISIPALAESATHYADALIAELNKEK